MIHQQKLCFGVWRPLLSCQEGMVSRWTFLRKFQQFYVPWRYLMAGFLPDWGSCDVARSNSHFQTDTSSQKYEVGQVNRVALMLKILSSRRFWVCSRDFPPSFLPAPISIPSMPMGFPQDFPPYFALGSFQKNALSLGVPEEHRADQ